MSLNNVQLLLASDDSPAADTYKIANSLRIRSSVSAYLNRTPSVAGNRKTFTWSGWVKRGSLGIRGGIFGAVDTYIQFVSGDTIEINLRPAATNYIWGTTQVFRDPSAWYHIVLAVDTTQATATNRMKLYVNGVQVTSFASSATIPQNTDTNINNTSLHTIGSYNASTDYFDGYQAEVNFIDGQALTPSSFGAAHPVTGVWRPKAFSGTYGTNGFYLPFSDNSALTTSSNAGLGKDFSGNGNYFATNNISITSGTTYDSMTDVPTLTSATAANYCTANPLDKVSADSTSNGNLLVTVNGGATSGVRCNTINFTNLSGKWYWESTVTNAGTGAATLRTMFSMKAEPCNISSGVSSLAWYWRADGVTDLTSPGTFATSDVLMFAYDSDTGKMWVGKNGTWSNSGVPASGTGQVKTLTALTAYALALSYDTSGGGTGSASFNYGQQPFSYTPPTGYKALNAYNLPDPAVGTKLTTQPNKFMDATLYTGTGSTQSITNSAGFKPDLVWMKNRNGTGVWHIIVDSNRGVNKWISSNSTQAEVTTDTTVLTSFNSNGFTIGTDPATSGNNGWNNNGNTFVAWQWQAGQGVSSSNTNGSITSTVSVNPTAGFSIVTYTGNGTNATIGHGLGVAPSFMIFKTRSVLDNWTVYHKSLGATQYLYLSSTNAAATSSGPFNNTVPTSTVFSVSSTATWLNGNGVTYVAYCWAEIDGFSKFGSYTGNGSTDGTFVYTGFRPKYVVVKRTDSTDDWRAYDSVRDGGYNGGLAVLYPDAAVVEDTGASQVDILSNGFKLKNATWANNSGGTFIYMAFAENPFKYSLAR